MKFNFIKKGDIPSSLLRNLAYIDLMLSPLIFIIPGIPNENRFFWWFMLTLMAINCVCVAEVIKFLDSLTRRLGL